MSQRQESPIETGGRLASMAQYSETTSIFLLDAVDGTVAALQRKDALASGLARIVANATDEIATMPVVPGQYLDEDDVAVDALASAAERLKTKLARLVLQRTGIDQDRLLKDHHCDALHDAYESASGEIAELIELMQQARAAIIAHDMRAEPAEEMKTFATVDELTASLNVKEPRPKANEVLTTMGHRNWLAQIKQRRG